MKLNIHCKLKLQLLMKSVDFDNESDDLSEEENVPIGKLEFWQITVHVHGKEVNVSCGDATQRLKWLAHVAIGELTRLAALHCIYTMLSRFAIQLDGMKSIVKDGSDLEYPVLFGWVGKMVMRSTWLCSSKMC